MDILNDSNQDIIRQIGGYQYRTKGKKYRMNKYCLEHKIEDGSILIHNFFTGATILIRPFEYMNIFTEYPCDYAEFLLNNYFIVPENFDEQALVDLLRSRKFIPFTDNYLDHPVTFTILSTTKCNARCFYCYELGSKGKTHMTYETAEKVARYIMDVAPKGQRLSIGWFGGEPLFNLDVIDLITSRLNSAGYDFGGNMISNGYLFDEQLVKRARTDWHLENVQITLDGTEEMYNKVKNYIYKDGESPYKKVIQNIHYLLKEGIYVSVRMNCDHHNSENLKQLIRELHEEFKDYQNFSMYVWPIFEEGFTRTDEQKEMLFQSLIEIESLIQELGYMLSHGISFDIKGIHCMVDGGDGVIIGPNGDLGVCEHYIDKDFFSHIDDPSKKDMEVLKSWRDYSEYTELCSDCPIYPACQRMKKCPDEMICDKYQKDYMIKHHQMCLLDLYLQQSKQQECNCEGGNCCNQHSEFNQRNNQGQESNQQNNCQEYNPELQKQGNLNQCGQVQVVQRVVDSPNGPVTEVVSAKDLSNPNFVYTPNQQNNQQNNQQIEKEVQIPKNCGQVQVMEKIVNGPNGPIKTIVSAVDLSKEQK